MIDGDIIDVDTHPSPAMTIRIRVRLESIDTAEPDGKCPEEIALAIRAREHLSADIKPLRHFDESVAGRK
jgi:hypothetical protein